ALARSSRSPDETHRRDRIPGRRGRACPAARRPAHLRYAVAGYGREHSRHQNRLPTIAEASRVGCRSVPHSAAASRPAECSSRRNGRDTEHYYYDFQRQPAKKIDPFPCLPRKGEQRHIPTAAQSVYAAIMITPPKYIMVTSDWILTMCITNISSSTANPSAQFM